jgi:phosphopantothenoylcysteine decarboxylase/phosphopantothenate--cysteine ligase
MTNYATRFVAPLTFQTLSNRPVKVGLGGQEIRAEIEHIEFSRRADLIIIAPVTANTLAKIAHGLADNLLTTTVLASTCPVVLAPAMNTRMWLNPLTQKNIEHLCSYDRFHQVGPKTGSLACNEYGIGRMAEPEEILAAACKAFTPQDLAHRKVLVTAGSTCEPLDPVRYLTNRSSGRMGYALARAAAERGAKVVLISGPTQLPVPYNTEFIRVQTAADMGRAVAKHTLDTDVIVMAAAVADFRPTKTYANKIKKVDGIPRIELTPTQDILFDLGAQKHKHKAVLVGFAAETTDPIPGSQVKLEEKKLDLVVANNISEPGAGFEVTTNRVHLVQRDRVVTLPLLSKDEVAHRVLDQVVDLLC